MDAFPGGGNNTETQDSYDGAGRLHFDNLATNSLYGYYTGLNGITVFGDVIVRPWEDTTTPCMGTFPPTHIMPPGAEPPVVV